MLYQDAPRSKALGTRHLDILGGHHVEHGGAQGLDEDRRKKQRDGQGGQHDDDTSGRMKVRPYPEIGNQSRVDAEEQHEQDADPEGRHGKADDPGEADDVIDRLVGAPRREDGKRQGDDDREDRRWSPVRDGRQHPFADDL